MVLLSFTFDEVAVTLILLAVSLGIRAYIFPASSSSSSNYSSGVISSEDDDPDTYDFSSTTRPESPRHPTWTRRSGEFRSDSDEPRPHGATSKYVSSGYHANRSVYPPQTYSKCAQGDVYYNDSANVQPNRDLYFAGSLAKRTNYGSPAIQPPDNGYDHEEFIRYSNSIDIGGVSRNVFVECSFRVTNTFEHGYSKMVVALNKVDFGIERACLKHVDEGHCDSSCNPCFIEEIEIHGTAPNVENCNSLRLSVEPAAADAIFTLNNYRQFNVTLAGSTHPWSNSLGFQLGRSVSRQVPAFKVRATKDHAKASWIWTLKRFENGKKMNYGAFNLGRSPKLATYPNHTPLRGKDKDSGLAEATWRMRGPRQWNFEINVTVHVAAMKKHLLSYSLRHIGTLELGQEWRERIRRSTEPTQLSSQKDARGRDFADRLMPRHFDRPF